MGIDQAVRNTLGSNIVESGKERPRLFGDALLGSATPTEFLGSVIQSSTGYSFIVKDLEGKILLWNLGAQLLYGYSPDEVIGQSADMLHAPEDIHLELPRKMRETALKEGKWEGVISRITKDQLRLSCRVVMTPYSHDSGRPLGFVLISRDVSTEFRLRERISRESLFDVDAIGSSPDDLLEFIVSLIQASTLYSIIGTAVDGRVILWSEGARRIYGYEPVEVVGKANIAMLHAEEDQAAGLPQKILGTALQRRVGRRGDATAQRRLTLCGARDGHTTLRRRKTSPWLSNHLPADQQGTAWARFENVIAFGAAWHGLHVAGERRGWNDDSAHL